MESSALRILCKVLASISMIAGALGMGVSFLYLASSNVANITAGTSGFVAGAILVGSGLVSLSLLVTTDGKSAEKRPLIEENDEYGIMRR